MVGGGCGQCGLQKIAEYAYAAVAWLPHLSASASATRDHAWGQFQTANWYEHLQVI
ncbi:MAG: hypothetical protein RMI90_14695 [Thermoguttaceae bacterium]|nr:hypothetical protein [Thermoguttaceae bacterium]